MARTFENGKSSVQGDLTGCRTGNGEKLSSSQAESGQAIKSAVALLLPSEALEVNGSRWQNSEGWSRSGDCTLLVQCGTFCEN